MSVFEKKLSKVALETMSPEEITFFYHPEKFNGVRPLPKDVLPKKARVRKIYKVVYRKPPFYPDRCYRTYEYGNYANDYYHRNRDKILAKEKERRDLNRDEYNRKCREYYAKNREKRTAYNRKWSKKYRQDNHKRMLLKGRIYREENAKHLKEVKEQWVKEHHEEILVKAKERRDANKVKNAAKAKEWRLKNPNYHHDYYKKYYPAHKEEYLERNKKNGGL